jgi:predicted metal-dependent peptidase
MTMLEKTKEGKKSQEEAEYIKSRVLQKFPLLGVTLSHLNIVAKNHLKIADGTLVGTAVTDGETIYYHPELFSSLLDEEKIFVLAHEVMHVAFNHVARSADKDQKLWGMATDSVINQILKSEGLPLVTGSVDRKEARNRCAEEMYEILLNEEEKKQEKSNNFGESNKSEQAGYDSHEIWKEAVKQLEQQNTAAEQMQKSLQNGGEEESQSSDGFGDGDESGEAGPGRDEVKQKKEKKKQSSDESEQIGGEGKGTYQNEQQDDMVGVQSRNDFERDFLRQNRKERKVRANEFTSALDAEKDKVMAAMVQEGGISFGDLGTSEAAVDWKKTLTKSLEDQQHRWSYRRSNADNDYMARVEEVEDEELAETEVMLDVSGSVDIELLKEFLRQLKPILKTSRLKVGCFDEYFYGLSEIKNNADIDNFKIISKSKWTENWNLAVKSFSKRKDVNKIVFTDGYPAPGTMPDESTRNINVIWIVYGNKNFHPICGKVVQIPPNFLQKI